MSINGSVHSFSAPRRPGYNEKLTVIAVSSSAPEAALELQNLNRETAAIQVSWEGSGKLLKGGGKSETQRTLTKWCQGGGGGGPFPRRC